MQSFKSSPLLPDGLSTRLARNNRRVSRRRVSKEQEPLIPNPFREADQENFLPSGLRAQVEQLDYLSPANLQAINFNQPVPGARRSSGFAKHLQAMQNAAKKQEEMYRMFTGKPAREAVECEMEEESPMTIEEEDDVSLRAQHCFFRMDDDPADNADLNFFSGEEEEQDVIFYSQHMISESEVQEDYEAYFDV